MSPRQGEEEDEEGQDVACRRRRRQEDKLMNKQRTQLPRGGGVMGKEDRFHRQADSDKAVDQPCVVTIHNQTLDLTHWAKAHPGGWHVLQKFHQRDATRAFRAAGHSDAAVALLPTFLVKRQGHGEDIDSIKSLVSHTRPTCLSTWQRWRTKLFTNEDRYFIHKSLGIFCLVNYIYRFSLMLFGDPTAGMGSHLTLSQSLPAVLSLIPHVLLSLSSLLFHTVPVERVVGKPMIWQEFRAHNIIFGVRSCTCCAFTWTTVHLPTILSRRAAIILCGAACLMSCAAADLATESLRHKVEESTTATMPYWPGCSVHTQKLFKHVYAIAQFGATIGCLMVSNPAWPLAILLPIQGASLLMTLVRKGLISTQNYHVAYTISLLMVFVVGIRHLFLMWTLDLIGLFTLALLTYHFRRMGANKFALWVPVVVARVVVGDDYLQWKVW